MAPPTAEAAEACEYDRRRPLFDGTLPVEVVGGGGGGGSGKEEQALTIRVLKGQRARGERVLRLEVSELFCCCMYILVHRLLACCAGLPKCVPALTTDRLCMMTAAQVTTDASVGAMAAFLHSLDVGEADFPELKRDQRCVRLCRHVHACRWVYACWVG